MHPNGSLSVYAATALSVLLLTGFAHSAQGAVVLNAVETGGGVVISGGGTLNQDEFFDNGFGVSFAKIDPDRAAVSVGRTESQCPPEDQPPCQTDIWAINGGSSSFNERPIDFGMGVEAFATAGSGDPFGINRFDQLILPAAEPFGFYVPGDLLEGSAIYAGTDFATLGMEVGTYRWSWGEGETADSFTLNVIAAAPVPALGGSGVGLLIGAIAITTAMLAAGVRHSRRDA